MATGDTCATLSQTGGKPITLIVVNFNTSTTPVAGETQVIALGDDQPSPGSPHVAQVLSSTPVGNEWALLVREDTSCTTGTFTSPALTASTNGVLLAANNARVGATIFNNTAYAVMLALGFTATAANGNFLLQPQAYYEVPFKWKGVINGFCSSAVNLNVWEGT